MNFGKTLGRGFTYLDMSRNVQHAISFSTMDLFGAQYSFGNGGLNGWGFEYGISFGTGMGLALGFCMRYGLDRCIVSVAGQHTGSCTICIYYTG